jgi:IS5 family transposase
MWYRYGDFRYENGYPAQIVKVLPDLVTVDLLVHSLNDTEFPKCVKHHTSGVEPSVLRTNGHYATIEEHHQLLLADVSRQAANRKAQMEQAQKRQELEANQNAARAMLRKGRKPTEVANLLSLDLSWCQEVWEAFQGAGS